MISLLRVSALKPCSDDSEGRARILQNFLTAPAAFLEGGMCVNTLMSPMLSVWLLCCAGAVFAQDAASVSRQGLIAVEKVGNDIRFPDPGWLEQVFELESPGGTAHEMAVWPDRRFAYVPLDGARSDRSLILGCL